MRKTRTTFIVLGLQALLLAQSVSVNAQEDQPAAQEKKPAKESSATAREPAAPAKAAGGYLGIAVEPLHPAFSGHLPDSLIGIVGLSRAMPLSVFQDPLHSPLTQFWRVADPQFLFDVGPVGLDRIDAEE